MTNTECPHAHRCVHPCDSDECFLETLGLPNGPLVKWTEEDCDDFEESVDAHIRKQVKRGA